MIPVCAADMSSQVPRLLLEDQIMHCEGELKATSKMGREQCRLRLLGQKRGLRPLSLEGRIMMEIILITQRISD